MSVDRLTVSRGGRDVVRSVTFSLSPGEVTGLLGPSGCGKTTLLRSLVGVQRHVRGSVVVLGEPAGSAGLRRRIGYVTQAPAVYDDLTVAENLRYFAAVVGVALNRVHAVMADVGLSEQTGQVVRTLSGGQRARVSLASALLAEPELLVLDEPTVGLDPVLRRDLWQLFHACADAGATVLISSHVMDEAARCDRLLLMRDGTLIADDSPGGLLTRTNSPDVESAFLAITEAAP